MVTALADFGRLIRAGWVLARHDALAPPEARAVTPWPVKVVGALSRLVARRDVGASPGERLARALESLGPAYMKLGQILSTRSDLVGVEVADGLAGLKDAAAPFPLKAAREAVRAEFGVPDTELFEALEAPVAAASIAQVHRARTKDGADVAVKILRPGIEDRVARDLRAFARGARLAERIAPETRRLKPVGFIDTVGRTSTLEMDLRLEAAAAAEMAEIAASLEKVETPAVDWTRSGRRVLTTAWVDAIPLSKPDALDEAGIDREALAVTVIQAFLTSALDFGVFHADFHEGNLFAKPDGTLVMVDFGIIGRIGPPERRFLAEILHGFLERDYARIAEVHFDAGYVPSTHSTADFAGALRSVGEPIFGRKAADVSMGRLLLQLFEITDLFDMALRTELVLLQKTMVQAEGVARGIDPNFDMWEAARPIVARWMQRELGPEGLMRDAASDLRRLRGAVRRLPAALEEAETALGSLSTAGVRLDDDTVARLAAAQARATRGRSIAAWVLALAAAGLAVTGVAAALGVG